MTKAVIGVDAGGTTCRAALLWQGRRWDVAGPGCNASTDFDGARAAINAVLKDLAGQAGLTLAQMVDWPAYLGVAGVVSDQIGAELAKALPLNAARVEEDRRAAVVGALGRTPGGLAALGTGSFLAVQDGAGARYQGGYGLALGDEASGAWLGREALSASLRAHEGLQEATTLSAALLTRAGGASALIGWAAGASPRDFAAYAPDVCAAAVQSDPLARSLLQRGAEYVAQGLSALGWQQGQVLCLMGGVGPIYEPYLPEAMQQALCPPRGTALDGALQLAQDLA